VAALATPLGACTEPAAAPAPLPGWPRVAPLRSTERGSVLALDHPGLHLEVGMRGGRAPGQVLRLGTRATDSAPALHGLGFGFEQAGAALPLRVNRVEAVRFRDRAAIRVRGELMFGSLWVNFARTLTAGDVPGSVSITTELWPRPGQVTLVERAAWGKARPVLPSVEGPLAAAGAELPWIGGAAPTDAFVLGFAHGPGLARPIFDQHGTERYLTELRFAASPARTQVGRSTWKTLLLLQAAPLGEALRRFGWARGRPFPEVNVRLPVRPVDAAIRVELEDGRPYLRTDPGSGPTTQVPLPDVPATLRLYATASGHAPSPAVVLPPQQGPRRVELVLPSSGELRVRVTDSASRRPLPFRIRLWGVDGTATPVLGPEGQAAGALDTALSADGQLDLQAPPGTYRVFVSHGPQWSLAERQVRVVAGRTAKLALALTHEVDAPGWLGCDLHVHAAPSPDSEVSLDDRLRSLAAEGVAFAVPTDHNHVTDYGPLIQAANYPVLTIPGVEVTTDAPAFGHFNAFPFRVDPTSASGGAPIYQGLTPLTLFAALRAFDPSLAIQVNHPRLEGGIGYFDQAGYDPATGAFTGEYSDDYDLIEVWNGYDLARPAAVQRNLDEWLAMLQRGPRVATGSSDSHTVRASYAGYPRTYVYVGQAGAVDPAAVVPALKAGRAFVTNGPMLLTTLDGKGPGERVVAADAAMLLRVEVSTAGWVSVDRIDVYQGPRVVRSFALEPGPAGKPRRLSRSLVLARTPGSFVVVVARGSKPLDAFFGKQSVLPLAFTNPIWID
jgi:hypothetical protein